MLRENTNAGWEATLDGEVLPPVVVDGWKQGWRLPDSTAGGVVEVRYTPDTTYRWGLLAGLLAVLLLLLVLVLSRGRWRGPEPPPLGAAAVRTWAMVPVAAAVAGLVAGGDGLVLALVVTALAHVTARYARETAPLLLALPCLVTALVYLVRPWGSAAGWAGSLTWPQYVVLVPLVAALALAGSSGRSGQGVLGRRLHGHGGLTAFRRRAGRSTTR